MLGRNLHVMAIFLTGLALIVFIAVALLAIVRAGIRRQERCRCLTCQPPSPPLTKACEAFLKKGRS